MRHACDLEAHLTGQGYADRTIREYVKWASRLERWTGLHHLDVQTLTGVELRRWVDSTVPAGRESRKQAHAACKHLFTMLGRADEPWQAIRVPRKPRPAPWPLTRAEATRLRDTAILTGGRRGTATVGLIYTGCRPSEVAGWRWDGISDEAIRFWRPKVSDWHTLPIHPVLADALERFRPAWCEGFLFVGREGPHVRPATIWQWVREVAAIAGVERVAPSRLRDTVADQVLEATGSIDLVASMLGHSSTEVTSKHYVRTSARRLRGAVGHLDW